MSLTRGISTITAEQPTWSVPVNNNAAAGNTTKFGTSQLQVILGRAGTNRRRAFFNRPRRGKFTAADIHLGYPSVGTIDAGTHVVFAPCVQQVSGFGDGSLLSYDNIDQDAPTAYTTPGVETSGAGTGPGHNAGTARAVCDYPASGGSAQKIVYSDEASGGSVTRSNPSSGSILAVLNEAELAAFADGAGGPVMIAYNENEGDTTNNSVTLALNAYSADASYRPYITGTYHAFPYGFAIKADETFDRVTPASARLNFVVGEYAFQAGDQIRVVVGKQSDLSDGVASDWHDATDYVEDEVFQHTCVVASAGGTLYAKVQVKVGDTPQTYDGEIISQSLASSFTTMPDDGIIAHISASRVGCGATEMVIRSSSDVAFGADDYAYVLHGTTSGSLGNVAGPVSVPTTRRTHFAVLCTGVNKANRQYYRLVVVKDGTHYQSEEFQVSSLPATGKVSLVLTADLHAYTAHYEEEGSVNVAENNCPETYRAQLRDLTNAAILAETVDDGGPVHGRIELGDYIQSKLSGTLGYPVDIDGLPDSPSSTHALSLQDMLYIAIAVARKDPTLALVQLLVYLRGNHEGPAADKYGKDWDGVTKSPAVVGRNTIDPEVDVAGWTMSATDEVIGMPDGSGVFGGGDPYGRWGYIDIGSNTRIIWLDAYLYSQLLSGDPNDLPQTFDSVNGPSIHGLIDFLFNASTGVYRNSPKGINLFFIHNFTATRAAGGPGNYCWSWFDVASPKGTNPTGEWPGAAAWVTADPYSLSGGSALEQEFQLNGVHKMIAKYRPVIDGTEAVVEWITGHKHFAMVERPHDGQGHTSCPRFVGGGDDLVGFAPYSRGHRLEGASSKSYSADDVVFESSNGGYIRADIDDSSVRFRFRKIFKSDRFAGQFSSVDGTSPIITSTYAAGETFNAGPNAVEADSTVYDLTIALPDHPLASFSDSFGDDCVPDDTTTPEAAGTEQPAVDLYQSSKRICSNLRAYWKNYSSDSEVVNKAYLAVRSSVIDAANVLSTRRPVGAEDPYVWQGIRRVLESLNREITVHSRIEGGSDVVAMVQVCGGDVDPSDLGSPAGLGLAVTYGYTGLAAVVFDDGDTIETLTTLSSGDFSAMTKLTFHLTGDKLQIMVDDALVGTAVLSAVQLDWLASDDSRRWLGLAGKTNNETGEGYVVEFSQLSAQAVEAESEDAQQGFDPGLILATAAFA